MKVLPLSRSRSRIAICGLLILCGFLFTCSPLVAARNINSRYLEVKSFTGEVTFNGEPVKVGDRLGVNEEEKEEGLVTKAGASTILGVDDGVGTVYVSEDTEFDVSTLKVLPGGAKVTELAMKKGRVKVKVRRFRNRRSRFRIKTPTTSAGVRGTDMGTVVLPSGETKVAVRDGAAEMGDGTKVGGGLASLVKPGGGSRPPTVTSGNEKINLEVLPGVQFGRVRVTTQVNPVNALFINGQKFDLTENGELDTIVPIRKDRSLELMVRTPLGDEQFYQLTIPYFDFHAGEK